MQKFYLTGKLGELGFKLWFSNTKVSDLFIALLST